MYSMKKIDDEQLNTAKAVNITTEFNKFKDFLCIKFIKTVLLVVRGLKKIVIKKIVMIEKYCSNENVL